MKNIFLVVFALFVSLISKGQANSQTMGNDSTVVTIKSIAKGNKGLIPGIFADTAAANSWGRVKTFQGLIIFTTGDNKTWIRNTAANAWLELASSAGTITALTNGLTLTGSTGKLGGTLTQNTTISGNNLYNTAFDAVSSFRAEANTGTGKISSVLVGTDSILFQPSDAIFIIDSLPSGASTDSVLVWTQATGRVKKRSYSAFTPTWQQTLTAGSIITGNTITDNGGITWNGNSGIDFTVQSYGAVSMASNANEFLQVQAGESKVGVGSGTNSSRVMVEKDTLWLEPHTGVLYIDTLTNLSTQNTLLGWKQGTGQGQVGYVTLGSGLSLSSGILNSVWTTTGNDIYKNNSGNVGIGTSTPTSLAHINGVLQMGTAGSTLGQILMSGNTSGTVTLKTAAAAGTWSLTLPTNDGDASQVLTTDGSGVTSWTTPASTSPAGNFGNLQINRNGAFATPASDSLDFESATGLSVKGDINSTTLGVFNGQNANKVYIGSASGFESFPGIWFGSSAPNITSYAFLADIAGGKVAINANSGAYVVFRNNNNDIASVTSVGFGVGTTSPTAKLHIAAGTASASTAPLKFTSGTNLTTAEAGVMEYDGSNFFLSPSTTRKRIPLFTNATPGNGELLIGNGTDFTKATLTAGQNISITNGAGSVTIATDITLAQGTYTPTLTNTTNITSSTAYTTHYFRVGDQITVWGQVEITSTAAGAVELRMSLPVATSNFINTYEAAGTASEGTADPTKFSNVRILAVTSAGVVKFIYDDQTSGSKTFSFSFSYKYVTP